MFTDVALLTPEEDRQLRSPEVRSTVRAYAARLQRILATMGTLSDTGVKCDRDSHGEVTVQGIVRVQKTDGQETETFSQHDFSVEMDVPPDRPNALPPTIETEFLDRWLDREPAPLLLRAEFGCGKSVLLESAALKLAERLLDDRFYPEGGLPNGVPLPVRLRAWNWHENERFVKFLYRTQSLFLSYTQTSTLSLELLRLLLKAGLLVLLFDGLDELPGNYDAKGGTNPRERALSEIQAIAKTPEAACRLIVSSRPGYDADHHTMFAETDRIELKPFSEPECKDYVNRRFPGGGALGAFESTQSKIGAMLSKPLFLAAWCDRFAEGKPPEAVPDLMQALVIRLFDPQRIQFWLSLPTAQGRLFQDKSLDPADVQELTPVFAALFFVVAHSGFGKPLSRGKVQSRLRDLLPDPLRKELNWVTFLAAQAGLLQPVADGEWLAVKVPVTEYFAGAYLAGLATSGEEKRRSFIGIFRRWVWLPEMHETLFFAFAQLRSGGASEGAFADDHVRWLLKVSEWCPLHDRQCRAHDAPTGTAGSFAQDDLLHPLAVLAARLAPDSPFVVPALLQARYRADAHHGDTVIPVLGRIQPELVHQYIRAYIKEWIRQPQQDQELLTETLAEALRQMPVRSLLAFLDELLTAEMKGAGEIDLLPMEIRKDAIACAIASVPEELIPNIRWFAWFSTVTGEVAETLASSILKAAGRLPEARAEHCIALWLPELKEEMGPVATKLAWAIRMAAGRLPEARAEHRITLWLHALKEATGPVANALAWAISRAAGRLPEARAEHFITLWLPELKEATGPDAFTLTSAIREAAARLPEARAEHSITLLLHALQEATGNVAEMLVSAIREAAARLPEARAEHCITLLLHALQEATGNVAEMLVSAIREAAGRLPEARAEHCITLWLHALKEATGPDAFTLTSAIREAAARMPEARAEHCITLLLDGLQEATGDVARTLALAIDNAAARLPEARAEHCIKLWLHALREATGEVDLALRWAIDKAAARLPEARAEHCITLWLHALKEATGPDAFTLTSAIREAAARLPEARAEHCIKLLLPVLEKTPKQVASALAEATRKAAGRLCPACDFIPVFNFVRSFAGDNNHKIATVISDLMHDIAGKMPTADALKLAQELTTEGEHGRAMELASYHASLAARLTGFDPSTNTPMYEFLWRGDDRLLLDDDDLSHAPENIRELGALRADLPTQYKLLRESLLVEDRSQAGQLPPYSEADQTIQNAVTLAWERAARRNGITLPTDADNHKPRFLLLRIIAEAGLLAATWREQKMSSPNFGGSDNGFRNERQANPTVIETAEEDVTQVNSSGEGLGNKAFAEEVRTKTKVAVSNHEDLQPPQKKAAIAWIDAGRSTDVLKAIVKALNKNCLPDQRIKLERDGSRKHHYVDRNRLHARLNDPSALCAIASRALRWKAKSPSHQSKEFIGDAKRRVFICPACGHINDALPSSRKGHISRPEECAACTESFSSTVDKDRPEVFLVCSGAKCEPKKKFSLKAPTGGWTNVDRKGSREKGSSCPCCQTLLMPFKR
jgi:hypothetical protein